MIRTLIVDDSALIRKLLTNLLNSDPEIEVVGAAVDPYDARDMIKKLNPDVITLDIEMPRMNGLDFLRNLMRLHPMPVVMISTLTERGAKITLEALSLGAVEVVAKPKVDVAHGMEESAMEITSKVKCAAAANVSRLVPDEQAKPRATSKPTPTKTIAEIAAGNTKDSEVARKLIAVGASTGGTEALKVLLGSIAETPAGVLISQHIPFFISESFAQRMNQISALTVCQAEHNQEILAGHVYIAPGDQHLSVVKDGNGYKCRLSGAEKVNLHRPSVDVLFNSVAEVAGSAATGVILTGMGADGARGLKAMRDAGSMTVAQDEASCVIFGMPKEAIELGGVDKIRPLKEIAPLLGSVSQAACPGSGKVAETP